MPCSNKKARMLLKGNKAKIIQYNPFTIQLLYTTGETTQECHLGVDTGAKYVGIAVTSEDKVLAKGTIELRQDVSDLMKTRSQLRRDRRTRNTRYRPARFLNRKRPDNWLPPSVKSRFDSTCFWIDKFYNLIPNAVLHIEVGKFDIAKMINPDIKDYQSGETKGYYDTRYFVFARDNYTCQVCKKKNKILQTHHIIFRSKGGTNRADNLITVCTDCHTSENHQLGGILYDWMIKKKKTKQYKEPVFMNIVRNRLLEKYPYAKFTYGSLTSPKRMALNLSKTHYNDAITISGITNIKTNVEDVFYYKQFRKKKRSLHESIPRKGRKIKNILSLRNKKNTKQKLGVYLGDKILFDNQICWVYGFSGGDKSRECVARNISGELIKSKQRKNSLSLNYNSFHVCNHSNGWLHFCI